jgi:PKD repeat protein
MKKQLLGLGMLLCGAFAFGQHVHNPQNARDGEDVEYCFQHILEEKMRLTDPRRYASMFENNADPSVPKLQVYKIPVVFHVLYSGSTGNISAAQIQDALNILNRDYRRLNSDANNVAAAFQGMPADVEVEFAFATVAPNGDCFEGITRTSSTLTNNGDDGEAQVNAVIAGNDVYQGIWPHNKYLNIYVAHDIGGAAGYTFNPNGNSAATAANMFYNGIFILDEYCGSTGTSSVMTSRALTHEVGHWLNLNHTWGSTNDPGVSCGDDLVGDTPQTRGVTSCNLNENFCGVLANVENYMDYSYCSKMFTEGQKTRMRNALLNTTGGRSNIWTTSNLEDVGAISGATLCGLDFSGSATTVCSGAQITFTPDTGGNPVTAYSWSFGGGTPATSTAASPTVTFSTPGTYTVSLTVTSGGDNFTKTKTNYIVVGGGASVSIPFTEGFVASTFPPANWVVTNTDGSTLTWARSGSVGKAPTAGNSMFFDNYNQDDTGNEDEIRLPVLNMTGASGVQMTFDVAYAQYTEGGVNYADGLEVLVSDDCGNTFTTVYSKSGSVLQTTNPVAGAFTPTSVQWRTETIDLSDYAGTDGVIVKFRNLAGFGNRLYVDNVNIAEVSTDPPVASYTTPSSICEDAPVTFTNSSTGTSNTYSWTFAGGSPSTSSSANPSVTYGAAGTYNVILTAANANGTNTYNSTVTVNAAPSVSLGAISDLCVYNNPVTLSQGTPAGGTYSGPGVSGGQFNPASAGTGSKTITYTYTNGSGCSASAQTAVTVSACLSLTENAEMAIVLFPNPSSGTFTVLSAQPVESVQVFDQSGRLVLATVDDKVDITAFAAGIYTVRVKAGEQTTNQRMMLQK